MSGDRRGSAGQADEGGRELNSPTVAGEPHHRDRLLLEVDQREEQPRSHELRMPAKQFRRSRPVSLIRISAVTR